MNFVAIIYAVVLLFFFIVAIAVATVFYAGETDLRNQLLVVQIAVVSTLSLATLVMSLVTFSASRKDRSADERSHFNDFWFRTVLFPPFYEVFLQLLTDFKMKFEKEPKGVDMEQFESCVYALRMATSHFKIIDSTFSDKIDYMLDEFENYASILYGIAWGEDMTDIDNSQGVDFDEFGSHVLKELHKLHKRLGLGTK